MVKQLDIYADRLRSKQAGMFITRADVVRLLIAKGLSEVEKENGKK